MSSRKCKKLLIWDHWARFSSKIGLLIPKKIDQRKNKTNKKKKKDKMGSRLLGVRMLLLGHILNPINGFGYFILFIKIFGQTENFLEYSLIRYRL